MHVIQWARASGCPWEERADEFGNALCHAALGGHMDVVVWLWDNGCPRELELCASAALGGELEILQWLRAHEAQ